MAFLFRLENEDGTPVDPPTLHSAVPDWKAGHTIPLGGTTLRVVAVRDEDADQPPTLVVRDTAELASGDGSFPQPQGSIKAPSFVVHRGDIPGEASSVMAA